MDRFAVLGFPIEHSLSPIIHQTFAQASKITLIYEKILTPLGQLKETLQQFHQDSGKGANITVPLKLEAFSLCEKLSVAAKEAHAVNTIGWNDGVLWGDNTDGAGLVRDLTLNLELDLKNKNILILGTGGSAQGILSPLLALEPKNITIASRNIENAASLAVRNPNKIVPHDYDTLQTTTLAAFDLVINTTSASLQDVVPPLAPHWVKDAVAIDLAYRLHQETVFMQWARAQGARAVYDGLGMLVEQAALAFFLWHNIFPQTSAVLKKLRSD